MTRTILIVLAVFISTTALAKNGFFPVQYSVMPQSVSVKKADQGNLLYYGGPVISNAKTYVVYWGAGVDQEIQSKIGDFYKAAANSSYLDWLDEYNTLGNAVDGRKGTQQHIGRGQYLGAITITPNNTNKKIDDTEIQAELQKQIDNGKLPKPDDNTLYMIYYPPGITITASGAASCSEFCAYHGFKGAPDTEHFYYGVMPDIGGACSWGCSNGPTHFDSVTSISSHEFLEAITDPFPTPGTNPAYPQAWNDAKGNEIADICVYSGNNDLVSQPSNYVVQSEWDNASGACTKKSWANP